MWEFCCQLLVFKIYLKAVSNEILFLASCSHNDIQLLVYIHVPKYVSTFNFPVVNHNVRFNKPFCFHSFSLEHL